MDSHNLNPKPGVRDAVVQAQMVGHIGAYIGLRV